MFKPAMPEARSITAPSTPARLAAAAPIFPHSTLPLPNSAEAVIIFTDANSRRRPNYLSDRQSLTTRQQAALVDRVGYGGISMLGADYAIGAGARKLSPFALVLACFVFVAPCADGAWPGQREADPSEATSSRAARDEAVRQIPWKLMSPDNRRLAQSVINQTSIYRRLPTRVIDCDPDLFTFLLQHPEIVVDVWRVMGISQVALSRTNDGAYRGTDNAGTTGTVRYLFSNWGPDAQNVAVAYADGSYSGAPFVTPLKAQSLMFVRSSAVRETNGRRYITVKIDSFVRIEQMGIEVIAKTVQPWIAKTADQNFIETLTFVSNFSRTAEKNPEGMQRLAARLNAVDEPTRNELVTLCFRTAERYAGNGQSTRTGATWQHNPDVLAVDY